MSGLYMLLQTVITDDKLVAINHVTHLLEKCNVFTKSITDDQLVLYRSDVYTSHVSVILLGCDRLSSFQ